MQELNILCIEDDVIFKSELERKIFTFFEETEFSINLYSYTDIPQDIDYSLIDIFFLDVEIGSINTLDMMKEINNRRLKSHIIIVSNHDHYVFDTVKYQIFDYVRKTHFDVEIHETLNRLLQVLRYENKVITVKYNSDVYKIDMNEIIYVETQSHHSIIHMQNNEQIEIWRSYYDIFPKECAFLIKTHRSYVINMNHCRCIKDSKAFLRNKEIPISKKYLHNVTEAYIQYELNI